MEIQNPTFKTSSLTYNPSRKTRSSRSSKPSQLLAYMGYMRPHLKSTTLIGRLDHKNYSMFQWGWEQKFSNLPFMAEVTPKGFRCHTGGFGSASTPITFRIYDSTYSSLRYLYSVPAPGISLKNGSLLVCLNVQLQFVYIHKQEETSTHTKLVILAFNYKSDS